MTEAFDKLKAANIIPYATEAKESLMYFNYIGLGSSVLGLDGFNAVNAGTKKLTDDDMVAVIQQMMDWSKYYEPNFVGTSYVVAKALFATGKTAAMDAGSSDFNGYRQINPQANFGFMYWPASDANHKQVTNTGMEFSIAVNSKTAHADECVAFVKWLGSKDGAQSMTDNVKNLLALEGVTPSGPVATEDAGDSAGRTGLVRALRDPGRRHRLDERGPGPFTGKMTGEPKWPKPSRTPSTPPWLNSRPDASGSTASAAFAPSARLSDEHAIEATLGPNWRSAGREAQVRREAFVLGAITLISFALLLIALTVSEAAPLTWAMLGLYALCAAAFAWRTAGR